MKYATDMSGGAWIGIPILRGSDTERINECKAWCIENIDNNRSWFYSFMTVAFYFRKDEDATAFTLRFGFTK